LGDFDWISDFLDSLPKTEERPKNIFDISGYPNWENVNSNFLAFYLNDAEEHKMKRLFIDSLVDCIEDLMPLKIERKVFDTNYSVNREHPTKQRGRIDILIQSDDATSDNSWGILIENKIYHSLSNDLNDYWDSVTAKHKFGIVLSPWKTDNKMLELKNGNKFYSITHASFVKKVKHNLSEYFDEANSRHLLFLKEFFSNINSLYESPMKKNKLALQLTAFHENRESIEEIIKLNDQLLRYLNEEIGSVFESINYFSETSNTSRAKHYYYDWEDMKKMPEGAVDFRFWVDLNRLRFHNSFECYFELYGQSNVGSGPKLLSLIQSKINSTKHLTLASDHQTTKHQFHLFKIDFPLHGYEDSGYTTTIELKLKEVLGWNIEKNLLSNCYAKWVKLKSINKP